MNPELPRLLRPVKVASDQKGVASCINHVPAMSATQAPTREAALTLMLRQGEATAAQLAEALSVSVQVMRRHLRALEEEGLVEASPAPEGPGRPSNRWKLTAAGRRHFPNGSEQFALGLLGSMAASLPNGMVDQLLQRQATEQASDYRRQIGDGSLQERLERLVDLRRREGYVAEFCSNPDGPGWIISEFHCSVMSIAERFPCVCDQELQMIRRTFPDCHVERVHWLLDGAQACGFALRPC